MNESSLVEEIWPFILEIFQIFLIRYKGEYLIEGF